MCSRVFMSYGDWFSICRRCNLLLYYRHRDDNQITFIVDGALKQSGDAPLTQEKYEAPKPKKVHLVFIHSGFCLKFCGHNILTLVC